MNKIAQGICADFKADQVAFGGSGTFASACALGARKGKDRGRDGCEYTARKGFCAHERAPARGLAQAVMRALQRRCEHLVVLRYTDYILMLY